MVPCLLHGVSDNPYMDYVVAVPSCGRAARLVQETLTFLEFHAIPKSRIHVFVASQVLDGRTVDDFEEHKTVLEQNGFGEVTVVPGALGLSAQYMKIWSYFPLYTHIIHFSDSVPWVNWKVCDNPLRVNILGQGTLSLLFKHAADQMQRRQLHAWSVCPAKNAMSMQAGHVGLKFGL